MHAERSNVRELPSPSLPPHHADAEAALLAALLVGEVTLLDLTPLRAEHFFLDAHRLVFEAIAAVVADGAAPDSVAVQARLRDMDRLADVGGSSALGRIMDAAAALASPPATVRLVVDAWARREVGRLAARWGAVARRPGSDTGALIDLVRREAEALQEARSQAEASTDLASGYAADFREMQDHASGAVSPVSTGYPTVDRAMEGGYWPGKLVIAGARPGCGKTATGISAALRCAETPEDQGGGAVLFISAELPAREIRQRLVCHEARVSMVDYKTGRREAEVTPWVAYVAGLPIFVDDASRTIEEVRASVRRHQRKLTAQGKRLRMVVIDYYQELGTLTKHERRIDMLTEVADGLKAMRGETPEATILVLAQLRRSEGKNLRPTLSDIAECDMLGRPADTLLALWRPDPDKDPTGVEMAFPKNRGLRQDLRPMFELHSPFGLLTEREETRP